MTGGNVRDTAGVSAEIAQVNAVLQDFGLEVTPPSTPAGTQERIDLRDVAGAVAELQNYKAPSAADQEKLAGIEARLGRVAADLDRRVDDAYRESGVGDTAVNAVETRGRIMAHPAEAMVVQGISCRKGLPDCSVEPDCSL
jgi:hypothetical protein